MSNTIYDKLEKNVCKVISDNGQGTGFLISDKFILTAFHIVNGSDEIKVTFDNKEELEVTLHTLIDDKYKKLDIAILELNKSIDFYEDIKIVDYKLTPRSHWISRGYPQTHDITGTNLIKDENIINQQLKELFEDKIDLQLDLGQTFDSYGGLSGSPLVIDENIVGLINSQFTQNNIARQLCALSVKHFKCLLEKLQIPISSQEDHFKIISNSLDDIKEKEISISRIFLIFTADNITNNKYKVTGYIHDNNELESDFIEFTFENIHNEEEQKKFIKILHKESELDNVPIHFIIPPELFLVNFKQWKYNGTELIKIYHVLFHNKERFLRKLKRYNQMIKEWDDKFDNLKDSYIYESLLSISNNEVPYDSRNKIGAYFTYQPAKFEEINRIVNLANIGIWKYTSVDLNSYPQCLEGKIILCDLNKESRKWEHVALLWDDMSLLKELRGEIK